MDRAEMESLKKQLQAAGLTDEQIMDTFYETFKEGKMDRKDLETLTQFMGYQLTDEFKNDPTPDPIASAGGGAQGITQEQAEAAKEIKPGESPEAFKAAAGVDEAPKGPEQQPEGPKPSEDGQRPEEGPKPSEEDEDQKGWEEAQKRFKW